MKQLLYCIVILIIFIACGKENKPEIPHSDNWPWIDTNYHIRQAMVPVLDGAGKAYSWEISRGDEHIRTVYLFESIKYSKEFNIGNDFIYCPHATQTMFNRRWHYALKIIEQDSLQRINKKP